MPHTCPGTKLPAGCSMAADCMKGDSRIEHCSMEAGCSMCQREVGRKRTTKKSQCVINAMAASKPGHYTPAVCTARSFQRRIAAKYCSNSRAQCLDIKIVIRHSDNRFIYETKVHSFDIIAIYVIDI